MNVSQHLQILLKYRLFCKIILNCYKNKIWLVILTMRM